MIENESLDPAEVRLLGARAVVPEPERGADLIEERGRGRGDGARAGHPS
jgi:hypothetical protein